jgi:hypothetical protein
MSGTNSLGLLSIYIYGMLIVGSIVKNICIYFHEPKSSALFRVDSRLVTLLKEPVPFQSSFMLSDFVKGTTALLRVASSLVTLLKKPVPFSEEQVRCKIYFVVNGYAYNHVITNILLKIHLVLSPFRSYSIRL